MKKRHLVGLRETDQGREVVLITGGSLEIGDGLETEKRQPNEGLTAVGDPFVFWANGLSRLGRARASPNKFLDVGRRDGKGSRSGQIDLKAETNSVLSFRVSD